jgi:CRISPR-associated protein (TIGR02710 family)
MKIKAIVASVGGTPAPIIRTIKDYEPEKVYFVVSVGEGGSKGQVEEKGQIKKETADIGYKQEVFEVKDPENLVDCYLASLDAVSSAVAEFPAEEVLVNYTGGTKCMSAALVLASIEEEVKHCYIGGAIRDEVGRVKNDVYMRVFVGSNPRIALGVNDLSDAVTLFNKNEIVEAEKMLREAGSMIAIPEISKRVRSLREVVNAYLAWDKFDHVVAKRVMDRSDLGIFDKETREEIEKNKTFLERLLESTRGRRRLSMELVFDVISNAERRSEIGDYEDAVARLYRALEMMEQLRLQERGYDSSDMKIEEGELREKYERYRDREGKIRLPLEAGYEFLCGLGDEWGMRFKGDFEGFKEHLRKRNLSILNHGLERIEREDFISFLQDLKRFIEACGVKYEEVRFPKIKKDTVRRIILGYE